MCAALAGIASIPEGYSPPPDAGVWGVVIFTAVFATAIAFHYPNVGPGAYEPN